MFKSIKKWLKPTSKRLPLERLTILKTDSYPCDTCNIESRYCFKLHFADRTICVQDKDTAKRVRRIKKN